MGVVRSSLDNLRLQDLPEDARVYLERADEGLRRLATILSRMSEATRLEQVLAGSEREAFDLAAVVRGCVEGYRLANPGREILLREPGGPLPVVGAPDLVAQLLDKLVENALGFARAGTPDRRRAGARRAVASGSRSRTGARSLPERDGGAALRVDGVDPRGRRPRASRTSGSGSTSSA